MKNTATCILLTICLYFGFTNNAGAAFPIKTKEATSVSIQKNESIKVAATILNEQKLSPKPELINPEHVLPDVISLGAFVLGSIAVIIAFLNGFGLVLGLIALALGIAGMHMEGHPKLAKLGLIFGAIAIVIALLFQYVSL